MGFWVSSDAEAFALLPAFGRAVGESGLESPSMRSVAALGHASAGTLRNWFGTKSELHRRVLGVLGVKWGHAIFARLLPEHDTDWFYVRLRLAYEEIARTDPAVGAVLDELVQLERSAIVFRLEAERGIRRPDPRAVMLVHALLIQLWDRRAHPDRVAARLLLAQTLDALFGPAADGGGGAEDSMTRVRSERWPSGQDCAGA